MIKAFAPGKRQGCSWGWLAIATVVGLPVVVNAQTPEKSAPTTKAAPKAGESKDGDAPAPKGDKVKKDAAKAAEPEAAEPEDAPSKKVPGVETYRDPRAEEILKKGKGTVVAGTARNAALIKTVRSMATGEGGLDRPTLEKFILGEANELSNPANFAAVIDPKPKPRTAALVLKYKEATDNLVEMLTVARKANSQAFLNAYTDILLSKEFTSLLNSNLFARVEAMIVLGQTESPKAIKLFVDQLKDPNQAVAVKLWAAKGIANVAGEGTRDVPAGPAADAARALSQWLEKDKDLPWWAQLRAFEALGSLRMSASPASPNQPEFAAAAMRFLADREARPELRATAGWALGMMRVSAASNKYNFTLVAYNVGDVAVELAERVAASFGENASRSEHYTSYLLYQLLSSLEGKEGARESGLLNVPSAHPNIGSARNYIKQVDDLVRPLASTSVNLLRAGGSQTKTYKKELVKRAGALKAFLEKNAPGDVHLFSGGPLFPIENPQVAEAPGGK